MSVDAPARRRAPRKPPKERRNPPTEWLYAHRNRIFGVMMIGWFMSLMDVSIVNITIPELEHDFETSLTTVSWVANAYNIVFAVLLITAGRLADQFGRKKFFIAGLTIFTLGSRAVRGLVGHRLADRLPRAAGRRRRADGAARLRDHRARLPAGRCAAAGSR